jgi:hypothetical protein
MTQTKAPCRSRSRSNYSSSSLHYIHSTLKYSFTSSNVVIVASISLSSMIWYNRSKKHSEMIIVTLDVIDESIFNEFVVKSEDWIVSFVFNQIVIISMPYNSRIINWEANSIFIVWIRSNIVFVRFRSSCCWFDSWCVECTWIRAIFGSPIIIAYNSHEFDISYSHLLFNDVLIAAFIWKRVWYTDIIFSRNTISPFCSKDTTFKIIMHMYLSRSAGKIIQSTISKT